MSTAAAAPKSRIYRVTVRESASTVATERLVRASSQARAISHVIDGHVTADVASQDDLERLLGDVRVETAGETDAD